MHPFQSVRGPQGPQRTRSGVRSGHLVLLAMQIEKRCDGAKCSDQAQQYWVYMFGIIGLPKDPSHKDPFSMKALVNSDAKIYCRDPPLACVLVRRMYWVLVVGNFIVLIGI